MLERDMAKKAKVKTWIVSKRWSALSREQQIEEVRQAMLEPGTSNKKAATKLGATPGMVAGIRTRYKIPSTNPPRHMVVEVNESKAEPTPVNRPLLKLAASE